MLVHLSIHNYAIVEHLDLELARGMSVITGETGAGKSIMLDALGLALGDRADSGVVRPGADTRFLRTLPVPFELCCERVGPLIVRLPADRVYGLGSFCPKTYLHI